MHLFLGTEDMPIYNFDKVISTNDLRYLVVDWDYRSEIEIPEDAESKWDEIYNEYCLKTQNNKSLTYYALISEVSYLETRYNILIILIKALREGNKELFGKEINSWGFKFNIKGNVLEQLPLLSNQLRAAKQKIDVRLTSLNAMKSDEVSTSLIKQCIKLKRVTGLDIDTKKTSVDEWIAIHEEAKEIIELQKKNNG